MDQQDQQKHVCKYCDRIFPCGQSLEGHMRSHVVNLVTSDDDVAKISNAEENGDTSKLNFQQKITTSNTSYGLRENPKKTNRFTRLSEEVLSDGNLCKLCGKGFQSSKALFGHMKCHSEKLAVNAFMEEEISSQSDGNEEPDASLQYSRRRSVRMMRTKTSYSSENEREDVARSLMMLSNDSWGSKELCSDEDIVFATPKGNGGKRTGKEVCLDEIYSCKKAVHFADELGFNKRSSKKNKFQCVTCKKIFHSYQALGGHRASHKKIKGCYASKFDQVLENSSEQAHSVTTKTDSNLTITENREMHDSTNERLKKGKSKEHECPFCFKIFSSGQALGGHKRSHLLNSSAINSNQSIVIQAPTISGHDHDLLDLNLPAPTEDDTPSQVTDFRINQWRGTGGCAKPEAPIGFYLQKSTLESSTGKSLSRTVKTDKIQFLQTHSFESY